MKDNLFDGKWTFLDTVKICLLVVTAFSTWNVVDIITPEGGLSFVREIAALLVVEGAFLAFEKATADAKNKKQMQLATIGFFVSLAVIVLFAATSGLLEFGGESLLAQSAGTFLGIAWTARDIVTVAALMTLVIWMAALATIYRIYGLYDPQKMLEMAEQEASGRVADEGITALNHALEKTKGTVAKHRALVRIKSAYTGELTPDELSALIAEAEGELATRYDAPIPANPEMPFLPRNQSVAISPRQSVPTIPQAKAEEKPVGFPTPAYEPTARRTEPNYSPAPDSDAMKAWKNALANTGFEPSEITVQDVIEGGDCTVPVEAFSERKPAATNDLIGQVNGASGVGLPCFLRGYIHKDASITHTCAVCGFNKGIERDDERIQLLAALAKKV